MQTLVLGADGPGIMLLEHYVSTEYYGKHEPHVPKSLGARGATCIATAPAPSLPPFIKPGIYTDVCTPLLEQPWSSGKAALYEN